MRIQRFVMKLAVASTAILLWGCGTANDKAPSVDVSGIHPAGWIVSHRQAYSNAILFDGATQCRSCHGNDLRGGIAKVDCFNGIAGQQCHMNGHGPRVANHALPFRDASLHGPAANADLASCQQCHGTSGGPGSNPRFNLAIGSLVNGCEDCHKLASAHPPVDPAKVPGFPGTWNGHASAGNLANSCSLCHGLDYNGATVTVGTTRVTVPACRSCHTVLAVGVLPVAGQCISCHDRPPATGAHSSHNAVGSITNLCTACHTGGGNGSPKHGTGFVIISSASAFNAKGGVAAISAGKTCSNVSCHGGIVTPPWPTGMIDVATQCGSCHIAGTAFQTPQFNSYYSGQHNFHITTVGVICTDCHDMSVTNNGNSHFSNLATPAFELAPALTIKAPVNYVGGTCNPGSIPPAGTFSIGICHATRTW